MDANGNSVMDLAHWGFASVVRFKRMPEGVRISEIDVVKSVCGKDTNYAGNMMVFIKLINVHNSFSIFNFISKSSSGVFPELYLNFT